MINIDGDIRQETYRALLPVEQQENQKKVLWLISHNPHKVHFASIHIIQLERTSIRLLWARWPNWSKNGLIGSDSSTNKFQFLINHGMSI